jgi:hypothetical protein
MLVTTDAVRVGGEGAVAEMCEPPISRIVAGLLVLVGVFFAARGARQLLRGLRHAVPLEVVRGIRGCVVAMALGAFTIGILAAQSGFFVLGAVFLGEELYETGILAAIIRSGEA